MANMNIVKALFATQVSSSFASFLASSAIVLFVSLKGFSNPYRRIIFGLSVSDIFQSLGLAIGPFLVHAELPQAIWSVGNARTCQFAGFLLIVGMNAVPMYTLCLCIYYVCKCKNKMTDEQFAVKVEKKMHIFVITYNLVFFFIALGLGTVNPGAMGNACFIAAAPAGCRISSSRFGECDPFIERASNVLNVTSSAIVPVICLAGTMVCLSILFWNVILMERISIGWYRPSRREIPKPAQETGEIRRNRFLRLRDGNGHVDFSEKSSAAPLEVTFLGEQNDIRLKSTKNEDRNSIHLTGTKDECHSRSQSRHDKVKNLDIEPNAMNIAPGPGVDNQAASRGSSNVLANITTTSRHDLEAASRRYKEQLVTQALCYVMVFCLSMVPFLTSNFVLLSGKIAPFSMAWAYVILYPLSGLFNIIVYTRLNVVAFRNRHPECSRLRAFLWVLRAGGEIPNDEEWNQRNAHIISDLGNSDLRNGRELSVFKSVDRHLIDSSSLDEENPRSGSGDLENSADKGSENLESVQAQGVDIELKYPLTPSRLIEAGLLSEENTKKSMPGSSLSGMNGMSQSFGEENPAYRPSNQWKNTKDRHTPPRRLEQNVVIVQGGLTSVKCSSISNVSNAFCNDEEGKGWEDEF